MYVSTVYSTERTGQVRRLDDNKFSKEQTLNAFKYFKCWYFCPRIVLSRFHTSYLIHVVNNLVVFYIFFKTYRWMFQFYCPALLCTKPSALMRHLNRLIFHLDFIYSFFFTRFILGWVTGHNQFIWLITYHCCIAK